MTTEKTLNKLAMIAKDHCEDFYIENNKFMLITHFFDKASDRSFSKEEEIESIPQFLQILGYYEDGYEDFCNA